MVTKVYGDTGVDKIVDGTVTSSDLGTGVGGKILQVQSTTKTNTWSGTTGSWQDITGFSVSITPSSTSSKVLVNVHINGSNSDLAAFRLMRDATPIGIGDSGGGSRQQGTIGAMSFPRDGNRCFAASMMFLDSPSTTSATTYKIQGITEGSTFFVNRSPNDGDSKGRGRLASSITVIEVLV